MTHTADTRREWQHNPSKGYTMLAVYIDGIHCGFVESHLQADALIAEIIEKRQACVVCQGKTVTGRYLATNPCPDCGKRLCIYCDCPCSAKLQAAAYTCTTCLDTGWESGDPCSANCPATVVVAAYIAPRPTARRAKIKTSKPVKKNTCSCPVCEGFVDVADDVYYCRADKEHIAIATGRPIARGEYLPTLEALNNHRYSLLTHPLPSDLSPEAAADVLAARELEPTA